MKIFFSFLLFVLGIIIGSFLNSVIYRLAKKESFLFKRSYCPHCKHSLNWQDLIPVYSFLALKGKCRYCQESISWQYPLVELGTGLIFSLIFWKELPFLFSSSFLFWFLNIFFLFFIACFLIVIFVYDLWHYIIPDKVIYPAILFAATWHILARLFFEPYMPGEILNAFWSALGAAAFFLVLVLVTKGKGMGVGDVKLAFLMGLLLGSPNILVAAAIPIP